MTGKVLDSRSAGLLILILPVAVGIVLLYKAWPLLLVLLVSVVAWKLWENYQWQQWCQQLNPLFKRLIEDHQGCLTVTDLSLTANLTGRSSRKFLERKAEEYGAQRKHYPDGGTVYYFLTASALGSIFEASESLPAAAPEPASAIAQLADLKATRQPEILAEEEVPGEQPAESPPPTPAPSGLALIQADLAKRLDLNPSTVGRRKGDPEFPEWSQSRDPEGIAWKYDPEAKLFVPADS